MYGRANMSSAAAKNTKSAPKSMAPFARLRLTDNPRERMLDESNPFIGFSMTPFFELIHEDKRTGVRAGVLHTAHGDVPTPCFMPVGTQASVKALDARDMEDLDAPIILTNTYHLHLRPGEDTIARLGGLHKFMNWNRPVLTDSGGVQIFSLCKAEDAHGKLCNVDDAGVTFRSHIDGSEHRFTPEIAVDIQHKLGADIIMAFDECTPDNAPHEYAKRAMERTHQWAEQSLRAHE